MPYVPALALRVYMYHNGKLNECMYVAVTTSLLYMRAGMGTNVMVMSVCNSSVVRKKISILWIA